LTNLGKANDDVGRLSSAEAANTELEGLSGLMQFGHLSVEDGAKLYQQYIVKIPFIDDLAAPPGQQGSYAQSPGYYQPSGPAQAYYAPPPQSSGPSPPQPPRA
jgi:hypothetical protein